MLFLGNKDSLGLSWFILGLLVWWSGLAGHDLYMVPVLVGILIMAFNVFRTNSFQNIFGNSEKIMTWATHRTLLLLLFLHGIVLTATAVFKLYSFQWNIWDVGIYSDIIFNTSKGKFYSSYNLAHNWGDHFTPSMSLLSIFYWVYPSSHWMTLSKVLALIVSPLLIWKICDNVFVGKKQVYYVGLTLSLFWLFFYAPIVKSSYFAFHPSSLAAPAIFYSFFYVYKKKSGGSWS